MTRVRKPRLIDISKPHRDVFAKDMGLTTPRTIGRKTAELAHDKLRGGSPPVVYGSFADNSANDSLVQALADANIIESRVDIGDAGNVSYHDINPVTIGLSENVPPTSEVRRYDTQINNNDIVVTLPAMDDVSPGKPFTLFRNNGELTYKVTVVTPDSAVIDNKPTYELIGANSMITVMSTRFNGWVILAQKNGDLRYFETVPSTGQLLQDGALGANTAYLIRCRLDDPMHVYSVSYAVGVTPGAANVDIGIYRSDDVTLTRIDSIGSTAIGAANSKNEVIMPTRPYLYPSFDWYVGFACNSATPSFRKMVGDGNISTFIWNQVIAFASAFPLPSTLALSSKLVTGNQPWVLVSS
jgi:hypothetical protein